MTLRRARAAALLLAWLLLFGTQACGRLLWLDELDFSATGGASAGGGTSSGGIPGSAGQAGEAGSDGVDHQGGMAGADAECVDVSSVRCAGGCPLASCGGYLWPL